ncbi:GAF domain-containing protein [Paractinoplanes atraurantiacus]|uniref:GAF domain-containing protein n=1 Tax=Paractinoplanes atraurantiacus TaxID=1036182 RepID=A0A285KJL6_9ACTN|nr:GAF domain-containing protein [Actinoplanes atraurantiacus]SNY72413.1 GAF domain-containing protein [Actinoplanes atraurantiacus]
MSEANEDQRALFGQSAAVFASLSGPEHVVETASPSFSPQPLRDHLDQVYRTGAPLTLRDVPVEEASFDFTLEPRRNADGEVLGVHLIGVETTQIKQAQRLMAEHRALLEQIARQAPLTEVLDGMARSIEELAPEEVLVSVLLADPDGLHLRHGAAPSLPAFYNEAIDGIATGEGVGSCGTAAYRREPVIVTDIASDPFWADFRDLAGRAGLAACWSTPILARDGALLGTFAMYHRTPRVPREADLALARVFAGTAALAIERHHAEARAQAANEELAQAAREAEERAARMKAAAVAQAAAPHPEHCQLGGPQPCAAPAEIKLADSWGDAAWGCPDHVEEAIISVRSVFIASEELGGLAAYVNRS